MAIVKFLGESYECAKAIKGDDYIHLLDTNDDLIVAFDGIVSFDGFAIENGAWTAPMPDGLCHVVVMREDGTYAKGSHRCSDIARPMNLLDNSDFRNPVNQRGAGSYTGMVYGVDRWKGMHPDLTVTINTGESITLTAPSGSNGLLGNYLPVNVKNRLLGKKVTLAVMTSGGELCVKSGEIPTNPTNGTTLFGENVTNGFIRLQIASSGLLVAIIGASPNKTLSCSWAALYEGEYTAEALPHYVPKGYTAELMECMRYYQRFEGGGVTGETGTHLANCSLNAPDGSAVRGVLNLLVPMRTIPTVEWANLAIWGGSIYKHTDVNSFSAFAWDTSVSKMTFLAHVSGVSTTCYSYCLETSLNKVGYIGLSADL